MWTDESAQTRTETRESLSSQQNEETSSLQLLVNMVPLK